MEIEKVKTEQEPKEAPKRKPGEATRRRLEALELARNILGNPKTMPEGAGREDYKKQVYEEVVGSLVAKHQNRLQDALAEKNERMSYFIRGGRSALNREISYIEEAENFSEEEKQQKISELYQDYAHSKLIEKVTIVKVVEFLLNSTLNPYTTIEGLARLTDSVQKDGEWVSNFDPDSNFGPGTSALISQPKLEEIRSGIQLALDMRSQVKGLLKENQGYDGRPDGRAIVRKVYGVEPTGRVKVIEHSLSMTLIFSDDEDYNKVRGGDKEVSWMSGGFHGNYINSWSGPISRSYGDQSDRARTSMPGLINCVRMSSYSEDMIAHENEHTLYEILMKNRGEKSGVIEKALRDMVGTKPDQLEPIINRVYNDLLFEAGRRFVANFANEALAYVLNNEDESTTVDRIVESNFKRLTTSKLYSHHHVTGEVLASIKKDISYKIKQAMGTSAARTVDERLLDTFVGRIGARVDQEITKQGVEDIYRSIIKVIAELKKKGLNNNYIRALLAGENPSRWADISKKVLNFQSDKSVVGKKEGGLLREQQKAAWALIQSIDGSELVKGSATEGREYKQGGEEVVEIITGQEGHGNPTIESVESDDGTRGWAAVEATKQVKGYVRAAKPEGEKAVYFNDNGEKIDAEVGDFNSHFVGGRIIFKEKKRLVDDNNRVILDGGKIGVEELVGDFLLTSNGVVSRASFSTPDGYKSVVVKEDGSILGMEHEGVKRIFLDQGELLMLVDTGLGSSLVKESGEVVCNFASYSRENIFTYGNSTYFFEIGPGDKYFLKDTKGNLFGNKSGYTSREALIIRPVFFEGGVVLKTRGENMNTKYFLLDGQEVPTKFEEFLMYKGELYFAEEKEGGSVFRNLEGKKMGGEDCNFSNPIRRFADGTFVFNVQKDKDGKELFTDEHGKILGPSIQEKYGKPEDVLKTIDGQYLFLIKNSDKSQSLLNEGGEELLRGEFKQTIETDKGWVLGLIDNNKKTYSVFNERGEKISDDYMASSQNLIEYYETQEGVMSCNVIGRKFDGKTLKVIREKLRLG